MPAGKKDRQLPTLHTPQARNLHVLLQAKHANLLLVFLSPFFPSLSLSLSLGAGALRLTPPAPPFAGTIGAALVEA